MAWPTRDFNFHYLTPHQQRVRKFMQAAKQELPPTPTIPSEEIRLLRAKLILEEALETIAGLGFSVEVAQIGGSWHPTFELEFTPDLVEIVDGCADISVVTIGTLLACGVVDGPILEEVDNANLRKFGPGSYEREDGKWIKPPDFVPPDILEQLKKQGYKPEEE